MSKKIDIWLVDDNPLDLFLGQKFIEVENIANSIKAFNNPLVALSSLGDLEPELWPDLIILDIQMPEIDGFEFLVEYEKFPESKRNKCNIVMLSSTLDFGDQSRAKANYLVIELLEKPLKVKKLISILEENGIL